MKPLKIINPINTAASIFIFFFCIFFIFSTGKFGGDGLENYLTAESIVLDRDFSIHDRAFQVKEMRYESRGHQGINKEIYSSYGLGMPLALVPFYAVGEVISKIMPLPHDYITQFAVSLANPCFLALLALAIYSLLLKMGFSRKISFTAAAIYSFCSMNFIYAKSGFSEPLIALLIILSVFYLYTFAGKPHYKYLLLAAAAFAYAIFIKKNTLILLPVIIVYLMSQSIKSKRNIFFDALIFIAPIIIAVIAIFIQNKIFFGGISKTEFGTLAETFTYLKFASSSPLKGLYYYLLSPGKGYLIFNLALIPGLLALKSFIRKYGAFGWLAAGLLLSNLLFYCAIYTRGSIFSWGARYLFPTLPLMALLLAQFIKNIDSQKQRIILFLAVFSGFIIQLPALFMNFSKHIFFVKEKLLAPEYLIDFMPELSPIAGTWRLFLSSISRHLGNQTLTFTFNPDYKFVQPISSSLNGYDGLDLWWVNILKIKPALSIPVAASMVLLIFIAFVCLRNILKNE